MPKYGGDAVTEEEGDVLLGVEVTAMSVWRLTFEYDGGRGL